MSLKIVDNCYNALFADIEVGEVFTHGISTCIKTSAERTNDNAFNFNYKASQIFSADTKVTRVKAKLIIAPLYSSTIEDDLD